MRPYCVKRDKELQGANLCRSCLFHEGQPGQLCDSCSSNSYARCAVCADDLPFARNVAQLCKYCVGSLGGYCMRCTSRRGCYPAHVCDTCHYKFGSDNYCLKTTRAYEFAD